MLSAVVVLLAVIVALHLLLTFALIARVRTLQEMVVGPAEASLPAPGTAIGAFEATTSRGELVSEASLRDDTVLVGFFSPNCPWCEKARTQLIAAPPVVPMLAFVRGSDTDDSARTLHDSLETVARVAYTATDDRAYQAFQPTGFPALYLIKNGLVAASGHSLADVAP